MARELETPHKKKQVEVCTRLPELYQKEGEAFLKCTVTVDETVSRPFVPDKEW